MSRPKWTRTHHGAELVAGSVRIDLWSEDGLPPFHWFVMLNAGECSPSKPPLHDCATIAESTGRRPFRTLKTAARHALAWVRKHLGPVVDAACDEPVEPTG